MFNLLRRDIIVDLLNGRITLEEFYWRLYRMVAALTVVIFAISIAADVAGFNGLNIILIPVWVLVIGYFGFHPTYLTLALATGGTVSLGRDADRQRIIDGIKAISEKWGQYAKHLTMFGGVFFLTRFLVPIRAYPFAGMVMLGATITLGLWSWLYTEKPVYYKRYVMAIILIALAVSLFGAFTGNRPAAGANPMAPMHNGVEGTLHNFFYSKTIPVEVRDLQGQKVCGIKPGTRKFSVPKEVYASIGGQNTELSGYILLNDVPAGQKFVVEDAGDGDGCANMSFAFTTEWKQMTVEPQIIFVTIG